MEATIQLKNGHYFDFTNPDVLQADIETIAHALSNICRFTGHCREFYSVAQHSVLVSRLVPPAYALTGLMHDATEAFVSDMASPLKKLMPLYRAIEDDVAYALARHYGLDYPTPDVVKRADLVALATERRDLLPPDDTGVWHLLDGVQPAPEVVRPLSPRAARKLFLDRYVELGGSR